MVTILTLEGLFRLVTLINRTNYDRILGRHLPPLDNEYTTICQIQQAHQTDWTIQWVSSPPPLTLLALWSNILQGLMQTNTTILSNTPTCLAPDPSDLQTDNAKRQCRIHRSVLLTVTDGPCLRSGARCDAVNAARTNSVFMSRCERGVWRCVRVYVLLRVSHHRMCGSIPVSGATAWLTLIRVFRK